MDLLADRGGGVGTPRREARLSWHGQAPPLAANGGGDRGGGHGGVRPPSFLWSPAHRRRLQVYPDGRAAGRISRGRWRHGGACRPPPAAVGWLSGWLLTLAVGPVGAVAWAATRGGEYPHVCGRGGRQTAAALAATGGRGRPPGIRGQAAPPPRLRGATAVAPKREAASRPAPAAPPRRAPRRPSPVGRGRPPSRAGLAAAPPLPGGKPSALGGRTGGRAGGRRLGARAAGLSGRGASRSEAARETELEHG